MTELEAAELNRARRIGRTRIFVIAAATSLFLLQGCSRTDVRGTYEVEIEIVRATAEIGGTLILSSSVLDVPALSDEDRVTAGEWLETDAVDANSCFILHGDPDAPQTPQNVRVFDARIHNNELDLPIEIYRTPLQRIEIVSLQFFSNTIGGEVILHDRGQQRAGRIHGVRSGSPSAQRCLDNFETFRAQLRASLAP